MHAWSVITRTHSHERTHLQTARDTSMPARMHSEAQKHRACIRRRPTSFESNISDIPSPFEQNCGDPQKLAKMIHYIRKQQAHLDRQVSHTLLFHGIVTFLPFDGDTLEYNVAIEQIQKILLGFDGGKMKFNKMIQNPTSLRLLNDTKPTWNLPRRKRFS